jgi:hypothetical protein
MSDDSRKTQAEVNYRQGARPRVCFECQTYIRPPVFACARVNGRIVPGKVCDLFTPKSE